MDWRVEIANIEGWHFGGKGSGLEDALLALVLDGRKTATCGWYEAGLAEKEPLPKVGELTYIMDSGDNPRCVVEVTSVEVMPFLAVGKEFARAEGEGDLSYAYWRSAHEDFFEKCAGQIGLTWNAETQSVVCERFRVVHRF